MTIQHALTVTGADRVIPTPWQPPPRGLCMEDALTCTVVSAERKPRRYQAEPVWNTNGKHY